jgi:sec-independent protein translocase protein TatB
VFSDIGLLEMLVVIVIAVVIFGPDKLPKMIHDTAGFIRKVRSFADNAKADIRQELGPEFKDFEFEDLNPKTFVRKNLLAGDDLGLKEIRNGFDLDLDEDGSAPTRRTAGGSVNMTKGGSESLAAGERPPYDPDAT